jgi:hypothetical protein
MLDRDTDRLHLDIQECFQSLERELPVSAGSGVKRYKKSIKTHFVSDCMFFVHSRKTNGRVVSQAYLDFLCDISLDVFLPFAFFGTLYRRPFAR